MTNPNGNSKEIKDIAFLGGSADGAQTEDNKKPSVFPVIKGVFVSLLITLALLFLLSVLAVYFTPSAEILSGCVIGAAALCIFISGYVSARIMRRNGLISGLAAGIVYALVVYLISAAVYKQFYFSPAIIANFILCGGVGALGGVIGINKRSSKKKSSKKKRSGGSSSPKKK